MREWHYLWHCSQYSRNMIISWLTVLHGLHICKHRHDHSSSCIRADHIGPPMLYFLPVSALLRNNRAEARKIYYASVLSNEKVYLRSWSSITSCCLKKELTLEIVIPIGWRRKESQPVSWYTKESFRGVFFIALVDLHQLRNLWTTRKEVILHQKSVKSIIEIQINKGETYV